MSKNGTLKSTFDMPCVPATQMKPTFPSESIPSICPTTPQHRLNTAMVTSMSSIPQPPASTRNGRVSKLEENRTKKLQLRKQQNILLLCDWPIKGVALLFCYVYTFCVNLLNQVVSKLSKFHLTVPK